jgi:hypothetical protein
VTSGDRAELQGSVLGHPVEDEEPSGSFRVAGDGRASKVNNPHNYLAVI